MLTLQQQVGLIKRYLGIQLVDCGGEAGYKVFNVRHSAFGFSLYNGKYISLDTIYRSWFNYYLENRFLFSQSIQTVECVVVNTRRKAVLDAVHKEYIAVSDLVSDIAGVNFGIGSYSNRSLLIQLQLHFHVSTLPILLYFSISLFRIFLSFSKHWSLIFVSFWLTIKWHHSVSSVDYPNGWCLYLRLLPFFLTESDWSLYPYL